MSQHLLLLICGLLLPLTTGLGQVRRDTLIVLPRVTVTATRIPLPPEEAPVRVEIAPRTLLERMPASGVSGVLRYIGHGFVRQYGTSGLASLSLRGASAAQVVVLFDGFRLVDPQLGQLDFRLFPEDMLEAVELSYGSNSALYGSDAVGGVVHVHPLDRLPGWSRWRMEVGPWGYRKASVAVQPIRGRWSAVLLAGMERARGDFPYRNRALVPPRTVRRENNDFRERYLYASVGYTGTHGRFFLRTWYLTAERGLPGPASQSPAGERQMDGVTVVNGGVEREGKCLFFRAGVGLRDAALRYIHPVLDIDQTGHTRYVQGELEVRTTCSNLWQIGWTFTPSVARATHPALARTPVEWNGATGVFGRLQTGVLRFYPAFRLEWNVVQHRWMPVPRLGWNMQLREHLRLMASAGLAFRNPTFNDRYWQPGGNPDLRPERGWQIDGGVRYTSAIGTLVATAFWMELRDQIVWLPTGSFWSPFNRRRTRSRGMELSLEGDVSVGRTGKVAYRVGYTLTDARDRSDPNDPSYNRPLRYVPREQARGYVLGDWHGLQPGLWWTYAGRRYVTTDGSQYLPPYLEVSLSLGADFHFGNVRGRMEGILRNLLNASYEVIRYYPAPPRHLRLRIQLTI